MGTQNPVWAGRETPHYGCLRFKGRARVVCPACIMPLALGDLLLLTLEERVAARDENTAEIAARETEIQIWMDMDLDAQAFIVKYIGAAEHTHIRNCDTAHEMWTALKTCKLTDLHEPVSPAKQATNLFNSLNTRYFGMIDIIQTWSLIV